MKPFIIIKTKYKPKNKKDLRSLIVNKSVKLWEIDTSLIDDMSRLFYDSNRTTNKDFEGIEYWNVSNVENMSYMFFGCENFNQPLNNWDVSNVRDMERMFQYCEKFNQPLNKWNVSNVKNMNGMFESCHIFNQDLSMWHIDKIDDIRNMFAFCHKFNQNITFLLDLMEQKYVNNRGLLSASGIDSKELLEKYKISKDLCGRLLTFYV